MSFYLHSKIDYLFAEVSNTILYDLDRFAQTNLRILEQRNARMVNYGMQYFTWAFNKRWNSLLMYSFNELCPSVWFERWCRWKAWEWGPSCCILRSSFYIIGSNNYSIAHTAQLSKVISYLHIENDKSNQIKGPSLWTLEIQAPSGLNGYPFLH